ncbi:hypothetical protein Tco_0555863 [Tanacetum coccineum]
MNRSRLRRAKHTEQLTTALKNENESPKKGGRRGRREEVGRGRKREGVGEEGKERKGVDKGGMFQKE